MGLGLVPLGATLLRSPPFPRSHFSTAVFFAAYPCSVSTGQPPNSVSRKGAGQLPEKERRESFETIFAPLEKFQQLTILPWIATRNHVDPPPGASLGSPNFSPPRKGQYVRRTRCCHRYQYRNHNHFWRSRCESWHSFDRIPNRQRNTSSWGCYCKQSPSGLDSRLRGCCWQDHSRHHGRWESRRKESGTRAVHFRLLAGDLVRRSDAYRRSR